MYNPVVCVLLKLLCAKSSLLFVMEVTLIFSSPDIAGHAGAVSHQYCDVTGRPLSVPKAFLLSQTITLCYRLSVIVTASHVITFNSFDIHHCEFF